MRGLGRIFSMPGSRYPWIAYCHRGTEYRESAGDAIREIERKNHRKLTAEEAGKVAENVLKQRLNETGADALGLRAFVGPQQDRLTVGDLLDALESDFRLRGLKSLKKTKGHLEIIRAAFGHLRAVDLTTETVSRYIEQRLAEDLAPATINRRTGLLAAAFRVAVRRRRLSSMPEIPKLREENARQGFFATSDFFAVLSQLGDQDVADFMEWFFWTGMRPGEIRSLTWQAFDSETWTLRLHAKDAKIGVGRVVTVEGPLRGIIERRMKTRQFGCDLIFHRNSETIGTFYKRWRQACLAAGVTGKIPYDLRRTAVRNMIRAGVPERVAMSISGHKTRAVFDRYNIVSEDDLREAVIKTTTYVQGLAKKQRGTFVVPMNQRPALKKAK
ncbi:MAG: hypothetical protein A3F68_07655 [Acidobacteria bacterium RIFCSPLOWO2_12_FULL_54_10]|nr:MAG: hypothetical protein A3F68_07655 [Acidobacteria bacterium RIFCSPLOWO2_12_FULL_54_10]